MGYALLHSLVSVCQQKYNYFLFITRLSDFYSCITGNYLYYGPIVGRSGRSNRKMKSMQSQGLSNKARVYWGGMPPAARHATGFMVAGWALHYAFYFGFVVADVLERTTVLQLAVGIGICYAVVTAKKWARMMSVFFNIGIFALYGVYSLGFAYGGEPGLFALTAVVALLFAASTLYMLKKETALHFNPPPESA